MSARAATPPSDVAARDRVFLRVLDARLGEGTARAGAHLACRFGCTECCRGPFPINLLDAMRLRRGLEGLAVSDPERAEGVRARAGRARAEMADALPGDARRGRLAEDEAAQDAFFARFAALPCPALDPGSGACDLYAHRPVTCRTYGLPLRIGAEDLPPCRLCFGGATPAEVEASRTEPDPRGQEDDVLGAAERALGREGSTLVAFALAFALARD